MLRFRDISLFESMILFKPLHNLVTKQVFRIKYNLNNETIKMQNMHIKFLPLN